MNGGPVTNWGARRAEQFPHLGNYTLTPGYALLTITVRLNRDGRCAEEFYQRRGIHQGSALSPLIFVLTLDFVMRVFQDACELEGLPSRLLIWNAYAEDIADKCTDEITATAVTAQLEAASTFFGLRLNTSKTESMCCRVMIPITLDATKAKKERVSVDFDDDEAPRDAHGRRARVAFEGWMTEIQFVADLGVVIPATVKCDASVAI